MKQDWARVSPEAKTRKILNKKSKRDILREAEIEKMGGEPVEVTYGYPLSDEEREERMLLWSTLFYNQKYPNRLEVKEKKRRVWKDPSSRTMKEYFEETFRQRRAKAKKRGKEYQITVDDLTFPEICPALGISLIWGGKLSDNTATIDCIDPNKGYVPGNVLIISHKANRIKNSATSEEVQKVADWLKQVKS